MKGFVVIRLFAVMLAALFLLGQMASQAHAADFGLDHDHDGKACAVSVLGDDGDGPVPPAPLTLTEAPAETAEPVLRPTRTVAFRSVHPGRAPPPRAPPL